MNGRAVWEGALKAVCGGRLVRALAVLIVLGGVSCSEKTKYRVLTFFFQGVPEPGMAEKTSGTSSELLASAATDGEGRAFPRPELVKPRLHWHKPYRTNRCNFCHDVYRGKLVTEPEDGLCVACHTDPPGDRSFVHGPVAANACLMCHHQHVSPFPGMLLEEVKTICFRCHDIGDLMKAGEHHAALEANAPPVCVQCHDPHGGNNRFFLKQSER